MGRRDPTDHVTHGWPRDRLPVAWVAQPFPPLGTCRPVLCPGGCGQAPADRAAGGVLLQCPPGGVGGAHPADSSSTPGTSGPGTTA